MNICGIGDLHLDGRLKKYIPNFNQFVIDEVRSVVQKAIDRGCKTVIFYGDIGDKPKLSDEAHSLLLDLLVEFSSVKFIFIKGNHDHQDDSTTGLDLLAKLASLKLIRNLVVCKEPRTLNKGGPYAIRLLPWPHTDVDLAALNVLHVETVGSTMDSGRPLPDGHGAKLPKKAFCVLGHLHTNHQVGNQYFSGTLYQTGFGEKKEKYWHLINIDDDGAKTVKSIPHKPKYVLENIVVKSVDDLKELPSDPHVLCKVFVNSSVAIPSNAFDKYPNVVKTNTFKTKEELQALILEDFVLDDQSTTARFELDLVLEDWLEVKKIKGTLKKSVLELNRQIKKGKLDND